MRLILSTTAVLLLSAVTFAQTPSPTQVQRPAPASGSTATGDQVTVAGCVMRESDWRKTHDEGKGGIAGTGVGAGNEFVLTNAMMTTGGPASGSSSAAAFELTGPEEGKAQQFIGRRVEIAGKVKVAEVTTAGPTGGPTAGQPPRGVDIASKDLKLRELEVASIKAATTGTCDAR